MLTPLLIIAQLSGPAVALTPPRGGAPAGLAAAPGPQDSARRDRLRQMLSVRDLAPACTEVQAQSPDRLVTDLQWLMDHIKAPPWVGVRAAQCILQLHAETETVRIQRWVQDPAKIGLILIVMGELDSLPEPVAQTIVQAALSGPHSDRMRTWLPKSAHPSLRALGQVSSPDGQQ